LTGRFLRRVDIIKGLNCYHDTYSETFEKPLSAAGPGFFDRLIKRFLFTVGDTSKIMINNAIRK
jgi:hypothetical protein